MKTKICIKCQQIKDLTDFRIYNKKNQRLNVCKKCKTKETKEYKKANPDVVKRYYLKNKDKIQRAVEKYRYKNRKKIKEYSKMYFQKNRDKYLKYSRKAALKRKFNLTEKQYDQKLIKQKNSCAICHNLETTINHKYKNTRKLSVDHCHKTGKIRGLLCRNCNSGIGFLKDSLKILESAASYLRKYK